MLTFTKYYNFIKVGSLLNEKVKSSHIIMVLVMALSVFVGCGGTTKPANQNAAKPTKAVVQTPASKKQKVIRFNNSVDPRTIDPAKEASVYEFSVENHMFECLVRQGAKGIVWIEAPSINRILSWNF